MAEENIKINVQAQDNNVTFDTLSKAIKRFTSAPFLFIGAGFSRRYMNTPTWEDLLRHFAIICRPDNPDMALMYYSMKTHEKTGNSRYEEIASLIQTDFNEKWISNQQLQAQFPLHESSTDPFHSAVAKYINEFSWDKELLKSEIDDFKNICGGSIAGIITTNYDTLLNKLSNFISYIGQSELLLSDSQELAEIYKIHGCCTKPDSIVITKQDYDEFRKKSAYLSAKLLTIFLEHPLFFIGYSLQDQNILDLFKTILMCFSPNDQKKLETFQSRIFFVDYHPDSPASISDYSIKFDDFNILTMRKISVPSFDIIFKSLLKYRQRVSVKILRAFKKGFVEFTKTNEPNEFIQVMDIDNERIDGKDLALFFGYKEHAKQGLVGKTPSDLYMDVINNDFGYSPDEILYTFIPNKIAANPGLPVCKYIALSQENRPLPEGVVIPESLDSLLNNTIIKHRSNKGLENKSLIQILNEYQDNLNNALNHMMYVPFERFTVSEIRDVISECLKIHPDLLFSKENKDSVTKSNFRRLIRILDYVTYKERAMERLALIVQSTP